MPPNFNEADVSDKPASIRALPLLDDAQIADIRRKYRCQLESLLAVDDGAGKVVDGLEAKGAIDNTLIVYTSDNGYFNGEYQFPSSRTMPTRSRSGSRSRWGPGIPQGVTVNSPVINADLAPTIVDATDADPGLTMDGRSLLPVIGHPGITGDRELLIERPPEASRPNVPSFAAMGPRRYLYSETAPARPSSTTFKTTPSSSRASMTTPTSPR